MKTNIFNEKLENTNNEAIIRWNIPRDSSFQKVHINIGTIGHVDHGKTTLTAAISRVFAEIYKEKNPNGTEIKVLGYGDIDKAPEERNRGITINATTIEYVTDNSHYAHTDCPGHADYVKNMITGARKTDIAIIVVDVGSGLSLQTKEHILLARRCGVRKIAIVFTKADMVSSVEDAWIAQGSMDEVISELQKNGYSENNVILNNSGLTDFADDEDNSKFIDLTIEAAISKDETRLQEIYETICNLPMKAHKYIFTMCAARLLLDLDKNNIRYKIQKELLRRLFDDIERGFPLPERKEDAQLVVSIEGVYNIPGRGVVVSGIVEQGKVKVGETVTISGGGRKPLTTIITDIEAFNKKLPSVSAGQDAGFLLRGIEYSQIERGMLISTGPIICYSEAKCYLRLLTKEEGGREKGITTEYKPHCFMRSLDSSCSIFLLNENGEIIPKGQEYMAPGDAKEVIMTFDKHIPGLMSDEENLSIILREGGRTIGQAMLLKILKIEKI